MAVPYTFASATSAIPLSQLDSNFATSITLGSTPLYLGNTTTTIAGLTLTSPTLTTPALGTPSSGTLTNCTGYPASAVSGTLPVANGGTGVTTSTGTGSVVLSTSPSLVTPVLGTPTSGTLTNCTGLPLTTGVTGTLPVANGGTNLTSFTANGVVYASSTSALATGSALTFDGTNFGLSISQNAATKATLTNSNAGASASARYEANNGSNTAEFGIRGSAQTTNGVLAPQVGYVYSPSAAGLALVGAAGPILFSTGGTTESMRLDSSGNLGIGTSSPQAKFVTSNAGAEGIEIVPAVTAGNSRIQSYNRSGAAWNSLSFNALEHIWITSNPGATERMRIKSTGDIKIQSGNLLGWSDYSAGSTGVGLTATGENLLFYSSGSERMRIDLSGNLLVGVTSKIQTNVGFFAAANGEVSGCQAASTNAAGTQWNTYSTGAGAYRFYVGMGGTIFATSTTITAISDRRLKQNIQDIDVGLDAVMALKPRKFDWKEGKGKDKKGDRGWIAQEFEQVFPDMIDTWADPAPEGEEPYKAVNADLIPVLVKAIQEQQTLIDSLTIRLAALEAK